MTNTNYTLLLCLIILYYTPMAQLRFYERVMMLRLYVIYFPLRVRMWWGMYRLRRQVQRTIGEDIPKYGISFESKSSTSTSATPSNTSAELDTKPPAK